MSENSDSDEDQNSPHLESSGSKSNHRTHTEDSSDEGPGFGNQDQSRRLRTNDQKR